MKAFLDYYIGMFYKNTIKYKYEDTANIISSYIVFTHKNVRIMTFYKLTRQCVTFGDFYSKQIKVLRLTESIFCQKIPDIVWRFI